MSYLDFLIETAGKSLFRSFAPALTALPRFAMDVEATNHTSVAEAVVSRSHPTLGWVQKPFQAPGDHRPQFPRAESMRVAWAFNSHAAQVQITESLDRRLLVRVAGAILTARDRVWTKLH
jgi:hypothetical protein